ncbi:hypothetical protein BaRGS_00016220, partial [Batillaria attramentaria]
VQAWLERLFARSQVPVFERNERTINLLYQLMEKNMDRDGDMQHIIEDLRHKSEEYTAEGQRLGSILSELNLKSGSLSQSGVTSLRTLANIAYLLQIRDASDTSYLVALQHLQAEEEQVKEAHLAEKRLLTQLSLKTKDALVKQHSLLKYVNKSGIGASSREQSAEMESRAKSAGFLHSKAREYTQLISKLKENLSRTGVDSSLFHEALDLEKLQEKLEPLKKKLQNYKDLPPDISQAKVKNCRTDSSSGRARGRLNSKDRQYASIAFVDDSECSALYFALR